MAQRLGSQAPWGSFFVPVIQEQNPALLGENLPFLGRTCPDLFSLYVTLEYRPFMALEGEKVGIQ